MKKSTLLILLLTTITISKADSWTRKADFPGGQKQGIGGFSIGSKGYIGTGSGGVNSDNQDFWEWDQNSNTWTQKANFPGHGRNYEVGFSIGNKGYIGTGVYYDIIIHNIFLNDFWEWDQTLNIWAQKNNIPTTGRCFAIGFSIGTKGYVGTGSSNTEIFKDLWEWDQSSDSWTQKADFLGGFRSDAVGFSIGTKGYIGTGLKTDTTVTILLKDFWEYDPLINNWVQKADIPINNRGNAVGFSIYNKGYIGEGSGTGNLLFNDFWEWDQTNNIWTQKADFGGGQRYASNCFSIGNKGYVCYGSNDTTTLNDLWEYFPDTTNGIPELTQEIKTSLYPNPMQDKTILTIQGSKKNALLTIYDINGQKVRSISTDNRQEIIIFRENLASGIYFYKLTDDDKKVVGTGKMLME
ncbi:MAG: T9SS type A sorting domain-containing protein [Bacteroidota bacterium]